MAASPTSRATARAARSATPAAHRKSGAEQASALPEKVPPLFTKLNWKGQALAVIDAPQSFEAQLAHLMGARIARNPRALGEFDFALAFVTRQVELDRLSGRFATTSGDAVVWIAYPKGSSKKLHCDFNRDTGFKVLRSLGFRPVRQVAIDEDWSALRFRRIEYVHVKDAVARERRYHARVHGPEEKLR